jgi:hypothetical protein
VSDREQFEQDALAAVQTEVAAAVPELQARGLELGSVDVTRQGEGDRYESEVRLYAYRDGQLCDALEVHLWREGGPAASVEELRDWFRSQLGQLDAE